MGSWKTGRPAVAATLLAIAGVHVPSPRFRRLDRRYYSPLCLLLAAGAAAGACA